MFVGAYVHKYVCSNSQQHTNNVHRHRQCCCCCRRRCCCLSVSQFNELMKCVSFIKMFTRLSMDFDCSTHSHCTGVEVSMQMPMQCARDSQTLSLSLYCALNSIAGPHLLLLIVCVLFRIPMFSELNTPNIHMYVCRNISSLSLWRYLKWIQP